MGSPGARALIHCSLHFAACGSACYSRMMLNRECGRTISRSLTRLVGLALLIVIALLLEPAGHAFAQGMVVGTESPVGTGLQADVVAVSPRTIGGMIPPAATGRIYTVQPGDTLGRIADQLGVTPESLIAANNLASPDRIAAGQVLRISPAGQLTSTVTLPPDAPIRQLRVWPWPPRQGQTLVIWVHASQTVSWTVRYAGASYPMIALGRSSWAAAPIDSLAPTVAQTLTLTSGSYTLTIPAPVAAGVFDTDNIPASASDPILSEVEKVNAEYYRMVALFGQNNPGPWSPAERFRSPLDAEYEHTSPYGSRRTYGAGSGISVHAGEDFAAPPGTIVRAPATGRVVLAEPLFVRGNAVVIDHGQGVFTGYWHMRALHVAVGELVQPGQPLGEVGTTGLSTGPHLHWELHIAGTAVDPLQWVDP